MKWGVFLIVLLILIINSTVYGEHKKSTKTNAIETNVGEKGIPLEITFLKGKSFDQPTFAFWIEDMDGKYIESLYVTNYLATGVYEHYRLAEGDPNSKRGPAKRPSSLPYWLHKRNIRADGKTYLPTPDKPVPDAITSATPKNSFILKTVAKSQLPNKFRVLMEINQPWDFNEFWNKDKFPGMFDYSYSCQPALVYAVTIDKDNSQKEYPLSVIGHSNYAGLDGELTSDVSTLTTALHIVKEVKVKLK